MGEEIFTAGRLSLEKRLAPAGAVVAAASGVDFVAILESPIPSRRADRPLKAAKARHPDIAWALAFVRLMHKDSELAERIMLEAIECPEGVWTAVVPSACKRNLEMIEAAPCHVDQQFVAVAK